jgi:hypothetical protein
MNKKSMIQILTIALTTAALLAAVLPGGAEAAVMKVKQHQLISSRNGQFDARTPFFTSCTAGPCFFYYPLKLPVGAVIKAMSYQHSGEGNGGSQVGLDRVNPGQDPPLQTLFQGSLLQDTGSLYEMVWVDASPKIGLTKKVQKGWDYFLRVQVDGSLGPPWGAVGTIKVKYNPPSP